MRTQTKKLELSKETVAILEASRLHQVAGGETGGPGACHFPATISCKVICGH
jgi:hypothetical protein